MRFKAWYGVAVVAVVAVVGVIIYQSVKYYETKELEKKNQRIVSFCEESRWNDDRANQQLSELKSVLKDDVNFRCSSYLYLKPKVKKSNTGICHNERSTYYYRTKEYKTFDSMEDCYKSGGRRPYN
jgi:hypothetical protein